MKMKRILLSTITASTLLTASYAADNIQTLGDVDVILNDNVTERSDSYTMDSMNSATKLNLHVLDTPQSISVITSQQMEDFNLVTLNDVLDNATGIDVARLESGRTQYKARGFKINNFLIDGIGSSIAAGYINGDVDTFIYDHIEVTRGATGLASNNGEPSATINMVRKRPTKETQGSTKLSIGSSDQTRLEFDVSGSLNEDETVRARVMAAVENGDSYLDRYSSSSHILSAIVDADINDNNTVTFGITSAKENNDGTQVGGFNSLDLERNNYNVSVNAAPKWAYMDTTSKNIFLELDSSLSDKWKLKATYTKQDNEENIEGGILQYNASTDVTTVGGARKYTDTTEADVVDLTLNGSYSLFDREHEIVLSANYINQDFHERFVDINSSKISDVIDLDTWDGSTSAVSYDGEDVTIKNWTLKEKSFAAATNFHVNDSLNFLVGSKIASFEKKGDSYGAFSQKDTGVILPYVSLLYKINDSVSAYTSYTTTYNSQDKIDSSKNQLDPEEGINYEAGVKSSFFDEALNSSFAVFQSKKDNVGVYDGELDDGTSYYTGEDGVETKGYEIEISGKITETVNASLGYTHISIKDSDGEDVNTYMPRKMINAAISYSPEEVTGLKVGASANWKSSSYNASARSGNYPDIVQDSHTIFNLMSSYQVNKKIGLSFNVNNVFNKEYYNSLSKTGYVTYGAPRSYSGSLTYKF